MPATPVVKRALAYPFDVPERSYILIDGQLYSIAHFSLEPLGDTILSVAGKLVLLKHLFPDATSLDASHFLAILASGSNAAPEQLRRKFAEQLNSRFVPVVRASTINICSVYSAHFAPYGSIPGTLHWLEGARADLVCVFLPTDLIERFHTSEALGTNYGFYEVRVSSISINEYNIKNLFSYISLRGNLNIENGIVRLPAFSYSGPCVRAMTEQQLFAHLVPSLSPTMDIPAFIERIVYDPVFRTRQIEILSRRFSSDNRNANFHRIA